MFDIAWSEMAVLGAVALVVIGPKDLPKVMREVGKLINQGRTMARTFRSGFDDMMRESELDDLRRQTALQMPENALTGPPPAEATPPDAAAPEAVPKL